MVRVSNGIRIFYTVNIGINGIRDFPAYRLRYTGHSLTVYRYLRYTAGIPKHEHKNKDVL